MLFSSSLVHADVKVSTENDFLEKPNYYESDHLKIDDLERNELIDTGVMENNNITSDMYVSEVGSVQISSEAQEFLKQHNIDVQSDLSKFLSNDDIQKNISDNFLNNPGVGIANSSNRFQKKELYVGSLNDDIIALKNAAVANQFTEQQIRDYFKGLIKNTTILDNSELCIKSAPNRTDGVGFEAQTYHKFNQFTSYFTLPDVNIEEYNQIVWHFVTVASDISSFDFTLRKGKHDWAAGYLKEGSQHKDTPLYETLRDGEKLYLNIYRNTNGTVTCKILNANNFGVVYASVNLSLRGGGANRLAFNKQITMTWSSPTSYTASITSANFENSYVYKQSGHYKKFEEVIDWSRYGTFGNKNKPGSDKYTTWRNYQNNGVYFDDVSISVPQGK